MYRTLLLLCVLCWTLGVLAQTDPDKIGIRVYTSPTYAWSMGATIRNYERTSWNGNLTWANTHFYLSSPEGKDALGLSDEQRERLSMFDGTLENVLFQWTQSRLREEGSEYANAWWAMSDLLPQGDYFLEKATSDEITTYREQYMNLSEVPGQIQNHELNRILEETLTPEQLLHLRTIELQLSPEIGLTSPAFLEPLGLSVEQKAELEAIKKEMEPEFEQYLAESTQLILEGVAQKSALLAEAFRENPDITNEQRDVILKIADEKNNNDEGRKQQWKQLRERQKSIATRLKRKFMNVLTDEQLDKMQQLIDHPSDIVKNEMEKLRKQRAAWEKSDSWRPGPGSWQPGDGIPESFKIERQEQRFPRKTKT